MAIHVIKSSKWHLKFCGHHKTCLLYLCAQLLQQINLIFLAMIMYTAQEHLGLAKQFSGLLDQFHGPVQPTSLIPLPQRNVTTLLTQFLCQPPKPTLHLVRKPKLVTDDHHSEGVKSTLPRYLCKWLSPLHSHHNHRFLTYCEVFRLQLQK
jgi:hypothetical protein